MSMNDPYRKPTPSTEIEPMLSETERQVWAGIVQNCPELSTEDAIARADKLVEAYRRRLEAGNAHRAERERRFETNERLGLAARCEHCARSRS